ncbi:MAG: hypothetical protein O2973_11220, partial [Gemmatimonadetes bacterium]|nr:hypothetical protein [Gemmatimonadota bacterium]
HVLLLAPKNGARRSHISTEAEQNDWVTLTGCGSRGATVIAAALQSDGVRRETELSRLDHLAGILDGWFQPQLIGAYQGVLRAPDASYGVRLRAMWLLSGLYAPDVDVAGPLQGYMTARCERYDRYTSLRDAPATLPAAAYDQARDAVAFAADDRSAPEYVRSTARCWEGVIASELANGTREVRDDEPRETVFAQQPQTVFVEQPQTVVVERPVRVVYECGSRFVFYNDAGYDLAVRYDGYGRRGVLRVVHGGPYVWAAARFGPVRFWVGEREVYYSGAVYRPCGGTRVVIAPAIHIWTGWHIGLGAHVSNRVYGSRAVYPRGVRPRVTRPIIIVNPRGNNPGNRGQPRNNPRDGRDNQPNAGPNNNPRGNPRGTPRGQPGNTPAGGGGRNETGPRPGEGRGSVPLPRQPQDQRPRFAVPKAAPPGQAVQAAQAGQPRRAPQIRQAQPQQAPKSATPRPSTRSAQPSTKPSQRSAQPSTNGSSAKGRSTETRGKPESARGKPRS